ncbi:hypothetical protein GOP47_0018970 [Adiantum capillus-veneris]|uniref:Uncharacterized protein n=1 Tax=Adiantum capillus-veneris TaxID=13818 RepID=A0A9D4UFL1_ADICA|nr:hypothetical protein GOP47_0018970 [Adiantum capillus-veneris]
MELANLCVQQAQPGHFPSYGDDVGLFTVLLDSVIPIQFLIRGCLVYGIKCKYNRSLDTLEEFLGQKTELEGSCKPWHVIFLELTEFIMLLNYDGYLIGSLVSIWLEVVQSARTKLHGHELAAKSRL